jgi:hypothetical protein
MFDERAQAVLGLLAEPLGLHLVCNVLCNLRETPQLSFIIG